jgi:hypothetical protein
MPCALPWTEPQTIHQTFGIPRQSKHGDTSVFTFRNETRSTVELTVPKLPNNVITVELTTNFVKAMDQNGEGFLYVKNKFPIVTLNSRKSYLKFLK